MEGSGAERDRNLPGEWQVWDVLAMQNHEITEKEIKHLKV